MIVKDLGRLGFESALKIQLEAVAEVLDGGEERVFVVEHDPVVTVGRHLPGPEERDLAARLGPLGVPVARASRGGGQTCHFPGQVVVYPVLRVMKRPGGMHRLVWALEEAVIQLARGLGVAVDRRTGFPGVWRGDDKLASIGLAGKMGVSYHGLAVNVGSDLRLFSLVNPCGLSFARAVSLAQLAGCPESGEAGLFETARRRLPELFLDVYAGPGHA